MKRLTKRLQQLEAKLRFMASNKFSPSKMFGIVQQILAVEAAIAVQKLNQNATYAETVAYLKKMNMWNAADRCSIWAALQSWIHSQKWDGQSQDDLKEEINTALVNAGLPYQYRVRKPVDSVASFKLSVNGSVLTFA